jgi:hypothetical protein
VKKLVASLMLAGTFATGSVTLGVGLANAQSTPTTTAVSVSTKSATAGFSAHAPAIAKALGMTTDELNTALSSGKTVASLAKEKGVDLNKIIATWVAEEQAEHPDMTAADVTKRVTDQANGIAPVGGRHGGGAGRDGKNKGGGFGAHAPAIAKALGMTTDELNTALASGKTVAVLAKEKGVDLGKIIATWVAEEQAEHPDMTAADVTKRVTDQANGIAPVGGRHGGGHGGGGHGGGGHGGGRHGQKDGAAEATTTVAK